MDSAISAVRAEVVTLSCEVTLNRVRTPPTHTFESIIIDLDAGTIKGPAGTANAQIDPNMVKWMSPYNTTWCQTGSVDRITGDYNNQVWKNTCQEVQADFNGRIGEGSNVHIFEGRKGYCIPANKKIF
jgi:hypothetical protein